MNPNDPPQLYATWPLADLRVLLFGSDRLIDTRFESKLPGDTAKVIKVELAHGQLIQVTDPNEFYFHVELFATHAEVWIAFEWAESNARRQRVKSAADVHRANHIKRTERIARVKASLSDAFSPAKKEELASLVVDNYKAGNLAAVLRTLNLIETLQQFEEEDKQ